MSKTLFRILLLLVFGTGLILLVEQLDAQSLRKKQEMQITRHLEQTRHGLQEQINTLVRNSEQLAQQLSADPGLLHWLGEHPIIASLAPDPAELTLSFTDKYKVVSAYPVVGSESVLGINYLLSPEFMTGIRRALESRATVIDSKTTLRQTNRQGIIIRTPYFDGNGVFLGLVSSAVDLGSLLRRAGWDSATADSELLLEAEFPGLAAFDLLGSSEGDKNSIGKFAVQVPEQGRWLLAARAADLDPRLAARSDWIRLVGGAVLLLAVVLMLKRHGLLSSSSQRRGGISLHSSVILIVVVPVVVLVAAITVLFFNANQQAAERLMQQQAGDLARQIRARVEAFFDVPKQAAFDVELFRNGVLDPQKPEQILSFFLSQLRVQPQLTFLSMGNSQGEYYAASRPPAGNDRNVRLQFATLETDREMRVHWVGPTNEPSENYVRGNRHFDARDKVWYQQALQREGLHWYPVYSYSTKDVRNQYEGLGIGVSSAVHDAENNFIGVITADVALLQLSDFLKNQVGDRGHTIFIAQSNGNLLATSDNSPVQRPGGGQGVRIAATESENPFIRRAGAEINDSQRSSGNMFIIAEGMRYLLDWHTVQLPDGPSIVIATIMPQSLINSMANTALRNMLYLAALLLLFGMVAVLFLVNWLTRPMLRLESWAKSLGSGQWEAPLPPTSPIREVNSLTRTLGSMASQLRNHASELEQSVSDRTRELALVNEKLAQLSLTDALTGIANRRSFDAFIQNAWQIAKRNGQPIALLMIDVDSFKKYNDRYGHQAGDQVLIRIAQTLALRVKRAGELLCRYGGEEFAIVLGQHTLEDALALAQILRDSVIELGIEHQASGLGRLSISIGVAAMVPERDARLGEFFASADVALYKAKKMGRNHVCSA